MEVVNGEMRVRFDPLCMRAVAKYTDSSESISAALQYYSTTHHGNVLSGSAEIYFEQLVLITCTRNGRGVGTFSDTPSLDNWRLVDELVFRITAR